MKGQRFTWYFYKSKTYTGFNKVFVDVWTGIDPNRSKIHKMLASEISKPSSEYVMFGCQVGPDNLDFTQDRIKWLAQNFGM